MIGNPRHRDESRTLRWQSAGTLIVPGEMDLMDDGVRLTNCMHQLVLDLCMD